MHEREDSLIHSAAIKVMSVVRLHAVLTCVVILLLCSTSVHALLEEGTDFEERHEGVDFPVGWTEFRLGGPFSPEVRMVYPAMFDGEDKDMAGNGPFSWMVFIGDSGESVDSYTLLTDELVKRGFIVVVTGPVSEETDVEETLELLTDVVDVMDQQNQSNLHVMGSTGNIDLDHWAVGGHGLGAAAAYLAFPFWDLSERSQTTHPPRGLVGLGLNLEGLEEGFMWSDIATPNPPTPNTGLFITGTVDEVAPSQDMMERVEANGGIAWHWMHLLGANHYQFQDSQNFFESDGDATMSQTAQISITSSHVVAYLDTVLHGDHSRFRDALNRGEGPRTVSDPDAYVDEDLTDASFLRWTSQALSHNASTSVNGTETLNIQLNWTLRDGTAFANLPAGWDVNITCGWFNGPWEATPSLSTNGTAGCAYPMAPVAPGLQKAWMRVEVEGAPSLFTTTVLRENTPIELLSPKPVVYVPQHGQKSINASDIAVDPDGQPVRLMTASLSGVDASHFGVSIAEDGRSLVVNHAVDEEWLGECKVDLVLRSDGLTLDEASTQLRVVLTPVDDPPVKDGTVAIQEMDEDGPSVSYNIRQVVSDPEGEELDVRIGDEKTGLQSPVRYSIEDEEITITPLPNEHGATVLQLLISDGVNPSLMLEIPVVVNPINDPVFVNASAWGNLTLAEDEALRLDLSAMAYDVDGDPLAWTLENITSDVAVSQVNGSMVFTPSLDFFGVINGVWLNVSDGTSTHSASISLTVEPVPDLPFVAIDSVQGLGGSTANMYWSVTDVDGVVNTDATVSVDNAVVDVNHSCLSSTSGVYQCVTLLPISDDSSTSKTIKLEVYDDELQRSVVSTFVFDPTLGNTTNDGQGETVGDESSGATGALLVGAGLALLAVLVVAVVMFSRSRGPRTSERGVSTAPETEQPTERSSGGLLERANRLK